MRISPICFTDGRLVDSPARPSLPLLVGHETWLSCGVGIVYAQFDAYQLTGAELDTSHAARWWLPLASILVLTLSLSNEVSGSL